MATHPYARAFTDRDLDAIADLLADDVAFHSPVITDPGFRGKASVVELLKIVFEAIQDEEFIVDLGDGDVHILVMSARVLDTPVRLTLMLEYDSNGKINEIWVMARPLTGTVAIAEAIGSGLASLGGVSRRVAVQALAKPLSGLALMANRTGGRWIGQLNRDSA